MLLIADEASGIEETIFEAMAGSLTAPEARLLLIGNPTRTSGEFYAAFHAQRDFYNCIRISAFDTPAFTGENVPLEVGRRLVSKTWVEDMTKKWGHGSPLWQVRVAAEFPSATDDAVVSLGDLEEAQRRSLEPSLPLVVACDVARFGSDSTVIATRTGDVVRIAKSYSGRDLMQTVGEILRVARNLKREYEQPPTLVVDDSGVGGGVVDRLQEHGEFTVVAFNAANAAKKKADYPRARDEAWFRLSELLPSLDLPLDEDLAADLLAPRYSLDSQGRRAVEPKSETKRRLRRSPDRADAVVMAFALDGQRKPMTLPQGWKARAREDRRRELVQRGLVFRNEGSGMIHAPRSSVPGWDQGFRR